MTDDTDSDGDDAPRIDRRRLLGLVAATGLSATAGCSFLGGDGGDGGTPADGDTPTDETPTDEPTATRTASPEPGPSLEPLRVGLPELVLPVAAIDDGMRLVQLATDDVPDRVAAHLMPRRDWAAELPEDLGPAAYNPQLARSVGSAPALGRFAPRLLADSEGVPAVPAQGRAPNRALTLVLGTLLYRGLASAVRDLHDDLGPSPRPTERSVYHDAALLRDRSTAWGDADPGAGTPDAVASLFQQCWRRSLVRTHTIAPDSTNLDGWIRDFADWRDRMADLRGRLADAYVDPDPALVERYVTEPNVHDHEDDLLVLVAAHHRGEADPVDLAPALEAAADGSRYAQGVRAGVENVRAAAAYLAGDLDRATLVQRLR